MSERFSLKDHLFNVDKVSYLGGLLEGAIAGFDRARFEASVLGKMPELELKQRIAHIAEVLGEHLDTDFARATEQIRSALPPPLDPTNLSLAGEKTTMLSKRHPLRSDATTYRLYPGKHRLSILVNGRESASTDFEVTTP